MRKVLLIVGTVIFLYSPYGPSWGRSVVNIAIVLGIFGLYSNCRPKRRYYEREDYNN